MSRLVDVCKAFEVLPSMVGVDDALAESVVSLYLQSRTDGRVSRRSPGDWAAMAARIDDYTADFFARAPRSGGNAG